MSSEVPEPPEASCLCAAQASIQAKLRPGIWIPGFRALHQYEEMWTLQANPVVCVKDVLQAVGQLRAGSHHGNVFTVSLLKESSEQSSVEILVFSRMRYVHVLKLTFTPDPPNGSQARARSFSSGILPAWFPLGFLLSSLLFFIPFYDCGYNSTWLKVIRERMTIPATVKTGGRKM